MTCGDLNVHRSEKWPKYFRMFSFRANERFFRVFLSLTFFLSEDVAILTPPPPHPTRRRWLGAPPGHGLRFYNSGERSAALDAAERSPLTRVISGHVTRSGQSSWFRALAVECLWVFNAYGFWRINVKISNLIRPLVPTKRTFCVLQFDDLRWCKLCDLLLMRQHRHPSLYKLQ